MRYNVIATPKFKQARINRKPGKGTFMGTPPGNHCYKIRLSIASKGKGKSGGARIITHVVIEDKNVYLLTMYDKSEKDDLTDKEIGAIIKPVAGLNRHFSSTRISASLHP